MAFQALLVSKDENASAVVISALHSFGVGVQCCGYPDGLCRVTEQKFDAVIVDFDDPHSATLVLQNVCASVRGKNAVTIALLGEQDQSTQRFRCRGQLRRLQADFH